jgi:hypothetical protein
MESLYCLEQADLAEAVMVMVKAAGAPDALMHEYAVARAKVWSEMRPRHTE